MIQLAYVLILLHMPGGDLVEINPDQITSLRSPRDVPKHDKIFPENAHCMINLTDGKFVVVQEDCQAVKKLSEGR